MMKYLTKSDVIRFLLLTIITILIILIIVCSQLANYKEKYNNRTDVLQYVGEKISEIRNENEMLLKKDYAFEYNDFIEKILKVRDKDFYETLSIIYNKSKEYNIDFYLICAIIDRESEFNQYARSSCAYGFMQINYLFWKDDLKIDFKRIYDKEYNIDLGIKIFKYYLKEAKGNLHLALLWYNNGQNMPHNKTNYRYPKHVMASKYKVEIK